MKIVKTTIDVINKIPADKIDNTINKTVNKIKDFIKSKIL